MSTRYSKDVWNACRAGAEEHRAARRSRRKGGASGGAARGGGGGSRSTLSDFDRWERWRFQRYLKETGNSRVVSSADLQKKAAECLQRKCVAMRAVSLEDGDEPLGPQSQLPCGRQAKNNCGGVACLSLTRTSARVLARCLEAYAARPDCARSFRRHVPWTVKELVLDEVARMSLGYIESQARGRDQKVYWGNTLADEPLTARGLWAQPQLTTQQTLALFGYSHLQRIDLSCSLVCRRGLVKLLRYNDKDADDHRHNNNAVGDGSSGSVRLDSRLSSSSRSLVIGTRPPRSSSSLPSSDDDEGGEVGEDGLDDDDDDCTWEDFAEDVVVPNDNNDDKCVGEHGGMIDDGDVDDDGGDWWDGSVGNWERIDAGGYSGGSSSSGSDDEDACHDGGGTRSGRRKTTGRTRQRGLLPAVPVSGEHGKTACRVGAQRPRRRSYRGTNTYFGGASVHVTYSQPTHALRVLVLRNCFRLNAEAISAIVRHAPGLEALDISGSLRFVRPRRNVTHMLFVLWGVLDVALRRCVCRPLVGAPACV